MDDNKREHIPLSKSNYEALLGKRYKVLYKDYHDIDNIEHSAYDIKTIIGYCENFNPNSRVVLYDEKYGFNIINIRSIFSMFEII